MAFHRGDYQEALKLMKSAMALGGEDEKKKGFALFFEETIGVVTPFKKYESPHFIISLDENQDGILADYLIDTGKDIPDHGRAVRFPAEGEDQNRGLP